MPQAMEASDKGADGFEMVGLHSVDTNVPSGDKFDHRKMLEGVETEQVVPVLGSVHSRYSKTTAGEKPNELDLKKCFFHLSVFEQTKNVAAFVGANVVDRIDGTCGESLSPPDTTQPKGIGKGLELGRREFGINRHRGACA